jgi:hypothetical protein
MQVPDLVSAARGLSDAEILALRTQLLDLCSKGTTERPDEEQLEDLRNKTIEVLLEFRRMYLAEYRGSVALKHWEHLETRCLSAARRSENPDEWATLMMKGLRLQGVSSSASRALVDLGSTVKENGWQTSWLDMVEREVGLLMALARELAEKRAEEKAEAKEAS